MRPYKATVTFEENSVKMTRMIEATIWDTLWYSDPSDLEIRAAILNTVQCRYAGAGDIQITSYSYDTERAVAWRREIAKQYDED